MKKLLLGLTAFLLAANAWAERFEFNGLYYETITDNTLKVVYDESYAAETFTTANIQSSFTKSGKTYTVTEIYDVAFQYCENLTSVIIPETITKIGACAFMGTNLRQVNIPSSVKIINNAAFRECSNLASVTIQEGVEILSDEVFCSCGSLESITIPSTITSALKAPVSVSFLLSDKVELFIIKSPV